LEPVIKPKRPVEDVSKFALAPEILNQGTVQVKNPQKPGHLVLYFGQHVQHEVSSLNVYLFPSIFYLILIMY